MSVLHCQSINHQYTKVLGQSHHWSQPFSMHGCKQWHIKFMHCRVGFIGSPKNKKGSIESELHSPTPGHQFPELLQDRIFHRDTVSDWWSIGWNDPGQWQWAKPDQKLYACWRIHAHDCEEQRSLHPSPQRCHPKRFTPKRAEPGHRTNPPFSGPFFYELLHLKSHTQNRSSANPAHRILRAETDNLSVKIKN